MQNKGEEGMKMDEPISRDVTLYTTGYKGDNPNESPLLIMALRFDREGADLNEFLMEEVNKEIEHSEPFSGLRFDRYPVTKFPKKVILIDASIDRLPTTPETQRVIQYHCTNKNWKIKVVKVDQRNELLSEVAEFPQETLILSQCVDKRTYNLGLAKELLTQGVVIVPGLLTAPGAILSDKAKTYQLLSNNGQDWSLIAPYRRIEEVDSKSPAEVATDILDAVDSMGKDLGIADFYVKPIEGGGGLGGFRMAKMNNGYIISDLSKVTGEVGEIQPIFLNIDPDNEPKVRELVWIFRLFEQDETMAKTYLWVTLDELKKQYARGTDFEALQEHIRICNRRRQSVVQSRKINYEQAREKLTWAIEKFEKKLGIRYMPLVNKHIDFGAWGLRVHLRLTQRGIQIEAIYGRIFQLALTQDGVGYIGSDNISNKQTGQLEPIRLRPVEKIMLDSIGGFQKLKTSLINAALALARLLQTMPADEQNKIPIRVQMDMAPVSCMVCEGNADTARGLVLASRWQSFIKNTMEWFEDSLGYYSRLKEVRK